MSLPPGRSLRGVSEESFRRSMGRFATGVTVMTTTVAAGFHGMTLNAFTSVSLDPPLVLVCIDRRTRMHGYLEESGSFALTVLSEEQRELSGRFAASGRAADGEVQLEGLAWTRSPVSRHPVLTDGLAYFDCEVDSVYPGGDHSIVVAAVLETERLSDGDPLVYYASGYERLRRGD